MVHPGYTEDIREAKQQRRSAERLQRNHEIESLKEDHRTQCNSVNALLEAAQRDYDHDKLSNVLDQKEVYSITLFHMACYLALKQIPYQMQILYFS